MKIEDLKITKVFEDSKVSDAPLSPELPKPVGLVLGLTDVPLLPHLCVQGGHVDAPILLHSPPAKQHLTAFTTSAIKFDPGGLARMSNLPLTLLVINEDSLLRMSPPLSTRPCHEDLSNLPEFLPISDSLVYCSGSAQAISQVRVSYLVQMLCLNFLLQD